MFDIMQTREKANLNKDFVKYKKNPKEYEDLYGKLVNKLKFMFCDHFIFYFIRTELNKRK
jgi:hypothetical protein